MCGSAVRFPLLREIGRNAEKVDRVRRAPPRLLRPSGCCAVRGAQRRQDRGACEQRSAAPSGAPRHAVLLAGNSPPSRGIRVPRLARGPAHPPRCHGRRATARLPSAKGSHARTVGRCGPAAIRGISARAPRVIARPKNTTLRRARLRQVPCSRVGADSSVSNDQPKGNRTNRSRRAESGSKLKFKHII